MECCMCSQSVRDEIVLALDKIEAMTSVAMNCNWNELNSKTIFNFFKVIGDASSSLQTSLENKTS